MDFGVEKAVNGLFLTYPNDFIRGKNYMSVEIPIYLRICVIITDQC